MTKEELGTILEANRPELNGVYVADNVEVWAFHGTKKLHIHLEYDPYMFITEAVLDDVYNIITGRTDLELAKVLASLCNDALVALRFATT